MHLHLHLENMELTVMNLVYFMGRLAPLLMVSFFVLVSVFNQDWKGLFYLSGIVFACVMAILVSTSTESLFDTSSIGMNCSFTGKMWSYLPLSSVILGFTIVYIFAPMVRSGGGTSNWLLYLLMAAFVMVDVVYLVRNDCVRLEALNMPFIDVALPIFLSYGLGGIVAFMFVVLATSTDANDMLYFGRGNNSGPFCTMPSKNTMTCKVYRNGELLSVN